MVTFLDGPAAYGDCAKCLTLKELMAIEGVTITPGQVAEAQRYHASQQ